MAIAFDYDPVDEITAVAMPSSKRRANRCSGKCFPPRALPWCRTSLPHCPNTVMLAAFCAIRTPYASIRGDLLVTRMLS